MGTLKLKQFHANYFSYFSLASLYMSQASCWDEPALSVYLSLTSRLTSHFIRFTIIKPEEINGSAKVSSIFLLVRCLDVGKCRLKSKYCSIVC